MSDILVQQCVENVECAVRKEKKLCTVVNRAKLVFLGESVQLFPVDGQLN